jgi:hypothetical protein
MAVYLLWSWTGRRFEINQIDGVRPVTRECGHPIRTWEAAWGYPYASFVGSWAGSWQGPFWDDCGTCGRYRPGVVQTSTGEPAGVYCASAVACDPTLLRLWHNPVASVVSVLIDGVPFTHFELVGRTLRRNDGNPWPSSNNLTLANTQPGTWAVSYRFGRDIPSGGDLVAGILANELALGCSAPGDCRLPKRVRTVSRAGTTIAMLDPAVLTEKTVTGIAEIDMWVHAANPTKLQRRASIHRADAGRGPIRWP